ncbi:MAG: hypothetical protein IKF97_00225 [Clostridia bacterium]|nr:hypothetical protein [Clostridia bacterium]
MEKKCKNCGTTKDVNFDGLCKKCYEESIEIKTDNLNNETNNNLFNTLKSKFADGKLKERIKTISIVFLLIITFCFAVSNNSQKIVELTNQVENYTKETEAFNSQITDLKTELENVKKQLEEKSKELTSLQEANKSLQDEKVKLETEKQTLNQELEQLKTSKANAENSQASASTSSTATKSTSTQAETTSNSYTVYITDTGKKYHSAGCSYLKRSQHAISKDSAIAQGYSACSKCNP